MKKIFKKSSLGASALMFGLSALLAGCAADENDSPSEPPVIGDEAGVSDTDESTTPADGDDGGAPTDDESTPTDEHSSDEESTTDSDETSTEEVTDDDDTTEDESSADADGGSPAADGGPEPEPSVDGGTPETEPGTETETDEVTATVTVEEDAGEPPPVEECVENGDECVSCPSNTEDYLHQCTSSDCAPFDNAARLGKFAVGEPLPEVP